MAACYGAGCRCIKMAETQYRQAFQKKHIVDNSLAKQEGVLLYLFQTIKKSIL
jgi:hypothetical protein